MALITCPECGREKISDKAAVCPGCGYPISREAEDSLLKKDEGTKTTPTVAPFSSGIGKIVAIVAVVCIVIIGLLAVSDHAKSSSNSTLTKNYTSYSATPKTGNAGALAKAESYLRSSSFSYTGLIDQLEFSGFSESEAIYAADNCGADWKDQALKKAKSYLRSSAFSYSGLVEQLEYSGFTNDEATYGADNCGADWNEQAVKKAASYLKTFDYTRSRLIDQLEYSGFTYSQAVYAADQNGL